MANKLILTIDDDEDFNRLVSVLLKKNGFTVVTCTAAADFLLKLHHRKPDLCLIDLNLSEAFGAGFQLIQAIKNSSEKKTPLFVLSFRSNKKDIARAIQLGASDYIHKPLDALVLLDKINQYIDVKDAFQPLPYFQITEAKRRSAVQFTHKIVSLNEFGITIEGPGLISRGTRLKVEGSVISSILNSPGQQLSLSVSDTWMETDRHMYRAFLEFNPDNYDLLTSIRNWLLANSED
jgi:DNA-binding response OmpR family regulator